jgi:signal transduction histidine kinase
VLNCVRYEGVGIPLQEQQQIFELFDRVQGVGMTGADGSGLGLAVYRGTAEAHGGRR